MRMRSFKTYVPQEIAIVAIFAASRSMFYLIGSIDLDVRKSSVAKC
jgi:hypothetical protein